MFIVAQHAISDPVGFSKAVEQALPGIPSDVRLHQVLPNADGTSAVCLWECESLSKVRELVETTTGAYSRNEYFEVAPEGAVGLPSTSR